MPVPLNSLVFLVTGSIPTNWTEDTNYRDKFLQGDLNSFSAPANAGGSHGHIVDAHSHVGDAHVHSISAGAAVGPSCSTIKNGSTPASNQPVGCSHAHAAVNSGPTVITYNSTSSTVTATGTLPSHVDVIVITPDDALQDIPDDAFCFSDQQTAPTGWHITDGLGGAVAINNQYIRGAATIDLSSQGSATHSHAQSHSHTAPAHSHATVNASAGSPSAPGRSGTNKWLPPDHHTVTLNATSSPSATKNNDNTSSVNSDPAAIKLLGIQNTSGAADTPDNVVIGFKGAVSSIPFSEGWALCDGSGGTFDCRNRWVKATTTGSAVGDFLGSNQHTHVHSHIHTTTSHFHFFFTVTTQGTVQWSRGSGTSSHLQEISSPPAHVHGWTISTTTPTIQNTTITMDYTDIRPDYRTLVWIKKIPAATVHIKGATIIKGKTVIK